VAISSVLATLVTIQEYEVFLLLIGAVFVPLFGVVLSDYYIVRKQKYTQDMMFGLQNLVGWPAMAAWGTGALVSYLLSPLSPIYMSGLPAIGATIPSLAVASLMYLGIKRLSIKAVVAE
jgi:purine-cytosine permease-like protein